MFLYIYLHMNVCYFWNIQAYHIHGTYYVNIQLKEGDYVLVSEIVSIFYQSHSWHQRWIAFTQMEPVSARSVLPCFDEPAMKAVFNVRITHRTNMTALSNGREMETVDHGNGWSTTSFEETPTMSTYLLAFAIGVFNYTETTTERGTRVDMIWFLKSEFNFFVFRVYI